MARIALVNAPFHSHVAAMLRLATVLARQGHELVVWAPPRWQVLVEQRGARFEPSAPALPASPVPADFAAITERETERLIPQLHDWDVDLLIRDSQTPWALIAAEYLGIPRIVSHPMFPMPSGDRDRERFEQSWLSIARRWGIELPDVRGLYHRTSEPTLVFTTEEIAGELPPSWRCVGPLLSPPPPRLPDHDPPLVYAAFGTAQNRRTDLFRIVIAALAREPVQLVVSAGGRRLGTEHLGPLPPNVTVHKFAPTYEMLARASVHITPGGSNSVHESLVAGVPMVCLPQAFDQIPLSERVAALGVGVVAEQDPSAVARAVLTLLDDSAAHAHIKALSDRLQRYDGDARVAAAVAGCIA